MAFWKFTGSAAESFPALNLTVQPGAVYDFGINSPPSELLPREGQTYPNPVSNWVSDPGPATDFHLSRKQASDLTSAINVAAGATAVGPTFVALGDSISANGLSTTTPPAYESRCWHVAGAMATDGRAVFNGIYATSGFTTAQVLATWVPAVLALSPLPSAVVVLAGRNDVINGVSFATTKANLTSIYDQLRVAGIKVITCTLSAQSGNTTTQATTSSKISAWIRQYTVAKKMLLCDLAAATTDPATNGQLAGIFADASHPTAVGAKTFASTLAPVLTAAMPPFQPMIAVSNTDPTTDANLVTGPLMLVDTNADGVPDNFTLVPGTATFTTALSAAVSPAKGNLCTVTRTGGTGSGYIKLAASVTVAAGDRVAVAVRVGSSGVEANSGGIFIRIRDGVGSLDLGGLNTWSADLLTVGLFYQEVVIPTGMTSLNVWMGVTSGVGTAIKVGQVTVVNLTAQGLL